MEVSKQIIYSFLAKCMYEHGGDRLPRRVVVEDKDLGGEHHKRRNGEGEVDWRNSRVQEGKQASTWVQLKFTLPQELQSTKYDELFEINTHMNKRINDLEEHKLKLLKLLNKNNINPESTLFNLSATVDVIWCRYCCSDKTRTTARVPWLFFCITLVTSVGDCLVIFMLRGSSLIFTSWSHFDNGRLYFFLCFLLNVFVRLPLRYLYFFMRTRSLSSCSLWCLWL